MSVTITRADLVPICDRQDMTFCDACITDLTLYVGTAMVISSVETMQHLTSLKLVGMHLVGARFQPQLKLQVLTISGGCMGNTQLAQIVQSYPSLKQVNLISMLAHCLHRLAPATPRYSLSE